MLLLLFLLLLLPPSLCDLQEPNSNLGAEEDDFLEFEPFPDVEVEAGPRTLPSGGTVIFFFLNSKLFSSCPKAFWVFFLLLKNCLFILPGHSFTGGTCWHELEDKRSSPPHLHVQHQSPGGSPWNWVPCHCHLQPTSDPAGHLQVGVPDWWAPNQTFSYWFCPKPAVSIVTSPPHGWSRHSKPNRTVEVIKLLSSFRLRSCRP